MIPVDKAQRIADALELNLSDSEAQRIAERILDDNLCYNLVIRGLLADCAPLALRQMRSIQRRDLLDRLRVHPGAIKGAAIPLGTATWAVGRNRITQKPQIMASCAVCNQSMVFVPPYLPAATILALAGDPENVLSSGYMARDFQFSHCGKVEIVPEKLLYDEYPRMFQGPSDADLAYEAAMLKERNKQIVEEQARKDRALAARLVGSNNPQVAPLPLPPDENDVGAAIDVAITKIDNVLKGRK